MKFNEKKLIKETKAALMELDTLAGQWMTSMEVTTEELELPKGRRAQIKITVQCDPDEFETVCPG